MADSGLRIIVSGSLIREPTGGNAWANLSYAQGLAELGHDVYYIEDSDDYPACYNPENSAATTDPTYGLHFAANATARLGLGDRWAYYDAHAREWKGARAHDARAICKSADLILSYSGMWGNPLREWFDTVPRRATIDGDPGFTQVRNLTDVSFRRRYEAYTAFFSVGANIGKPGCTIPADGFRWEITHPPISLAAWPYVAGPSNGRYTTVMQWETFPGLIQYGGLMLANKSESFRRFAELPRRIGPIFDIAVRSRWTSPHAMLCQAGWGIADIDRISRDPWTYQAFIQQSKAEFGIAKAGYVETRSGWFSERSVAYLASGRPVVHQDTGFPNWLPCGAGVFAFRSPADVIDAISRIDADYEAHCRAARGLAEEFFSAARVLPPLIEAAMATSAAQMDVSAGSL
jgi:hypothetical protein